MMKDEGATYDWCNSSFSSDLLGALLLLLYGSFFAIGQRPPSEELIRGVENGKVFGSIRKNRFTVWLLH